MSRIGEYRTVKCLMCSSNQDYLCEVHDHVLNDYSLSDSKLTLIVIGDGTLRANNASPDELSAIITVSRPIDMIQYFNNELTQDEMSEFKCLVLITPELLEVIDGEDYKNLLLFNYTMCPISLIFQNPEHRDTFISNYKQWIPPSNLPLPILFGMDDLGQAMEYLRDAARVPNRFIYMTVMENAQRFLS